MSIVTDTRQEVATALHALGQAYRGDWSDVDGRTIRRQLNGLADALTDGHPFSASAWAGGWLCIECQTWDEHCDCAEVPA